LYMLERSFTLEFLTMCKDTKFLLKNLKFKFLEGNFVSLLIVKDSSVNEHSNIYNQHENH
jgi:hypothetical protein